MGSHTQSAGTEEIARASGGDSMPLRDSDALEDTLARIRHSYAIYFAATPGVRAGEERQIELDLADSALRRYAGAQVHYRRTYYAPQDTPANSSPAVVSQRAEPRKDTPQPSDDPDRPYLRRRPGVSQDRSHDGPLGAGNESSSAAAAISAPQAAPPPSPPLDPNTPGWRKARPDELPPQ